MLVGWIHRLLRRSPWIGADAGRQCSGSDRAIGAAPDRQSRGLSPWRARGWLSPIRAPQHLASLALLLLLAVAPVAAASLPVSAPASESFRCNGVPLTAVLYGGAVDDPTIPNRSAGTLPGAFVQLQWQWQAEPIALQLPRTNNAGAPSFTDGKWWWSLEDPEHPRFRLRRGSGDIEDFACERA